MQAWQIVLLAFSGLGIFNSLALIIYLQISHTQLYYKKLFLQIILLAFVLQIIQALLELFQLEFSPYVRNLYLIGIYSQGPAMYLFIKNVLDPKRVLLPRHFIIHFLPYLLISLIKYDFENKGGKEWVAIYLVGIQSLAYVILCIKPYIGVWKRYILRESRYFLIVYLFPFFALLWINYPLSGLLKINYQIPETILHSAFLYYLMFLKFKEPENYAEKYKTSGIDKVSSREIYTRINKEIYDKMLYLDPDLNLSSLARKVSVQVNILSQVINQNAHLNFRDFINSFRIEKAKDELIDKVQKGFTIASVAFDCGFNSLSAFNRAFKKLYGYSPSEYIRVHQPR